MTEILSEYYNWIKAFHVIAIIAWMAGMLYLPRLFAYHADCAVGSEKLDTFKIMELRLLRIIMNPAMILAWIFGSLMLWANPDLFSQAWMHVKLLCILIMTGIYHIFIKWRKIFDQDKNEKSAKYYKIWNEIPTLVMIIIVIMAVAKPI